MWPGGPYGARIMSYHPPCAIHGTNEPGLLNRFPRNFSHGCTRLANASAIWLDHHAPLGQRRSGTCAEPGPSRLGRAAAPDAAPRVKRAGSACTPALSAPGLGLLPACLARGAD